MKQIERIGIIGLGAVGINFAVHLQKHMDAKQLWIIADEARVQRYQRDGIYFNNERCDFHYMTPQAARPVDLLLFTTKFMGLREAMETACPFIDEHTLLLSGINGITSEEVLAEQFHPRQIIYTVAQGMDATKSGNHVTCTTTGQLCIGDITKGTQRESITRIRHFFDCTSFPYTIKADILHHQWGKFMLNVGLNQVVAVHHGTYATIQKEGIARDQMLQAMKEVVALSKFEGSNLREEECMEWVAMCDGLSPQGMPSMAQDVQAKRKTEVELFAKEVLKRAKKWQLSCPMNAYLYDQLLQIEASYGSI